MGLEEVELLAREADNRRHWLLPGKRSGPTHPCKIQDQYEHEIGREYNGGVARRILCNDARNHGNLGPRRP